MFKFWLLAIIPLWLFTTEVRAEFFTITQYHVEVTFPEEGYADFTEIIEVEFSQPRHGILRAIPLRDIVSGKSVTRIIKNIDVEGHNFSTYRENNNMVLKIGDADKYVDGKQTYTIRYRILNPFNFFDEHIEFYWDLLGQTWEVDVNSFTFQLNFPGNISLTPDDVIGYTGPAGTQGKDVQIQVDGNHVRGRGVRKFTAREAVTVGVKLPLNAFKARGFWEDFLAVHSLLLVVPFFLLAGIFAKIYARNKRQTIMTEYFPPEGISPVVAGGFVDHSVDNNDVLSLIPHLANSGYLRLEAEPGKGFFKKDNIIFYKLKNPGPELLAFEQHFLNALFASGDRVELDDLKDKFYSHMSSIKLSVKEWIKLQGWYEPDQRAMGCLTGIFGLIAVAWGAFAFFARQNIDGIALIITGLILFYLASRFNKRSPEGNKTYQKLEGFRQFVSKAEKPVIERLIKEDPLYYDKTMPFALAFGYLKQWNRQFEGLLTQPPSWYSSPMMYGTDLSRSWSTFSESFPSEISSIGSVFSSTPGGSSGMGGGGGSSGGGSGGGGGGSW